MIKYFLASLLLLSFHTFAQAQTTLASDRWLAASQRKILDEQSLINAIPFKSIGPRIMSGRVVDLAVNPNHTIEFYVAFASGGLWYTSNNGQSFIPVFDNQAVLTIGAIAVRWTTLNNNEIWVGTGEVNSSRSSYSGLGVFKSMDGGKSWVNIGLHESHHIGKIILHPTDPNIAWVGVLGHLYSANEERGIYKTNDAGRTWKKTLFVDSNTGCVQLQIDPTNANILYANMWYRTRRAWNFEESGKSSGIYKSMDGGDSWTKISTAASGLPDGEGFGRSGIAVSVKDPSILYGVVDNQNHRADTITLNEKNLTADQLNKLSKEEFLKLEDKKLNDYLIDREFPERYTAALLKELVRSNKITVHDIVIYTDDANSLLFRTPIIGAEVYQSVDAGIHWKKQNAKYLDYVYNTYGYYFGQIVVSPTDEKKVYTFGVPLLKSADAGATWTSIDGENVHGDYHVLWIDPNNTKHLICGNDGGVNISYDEGEHWIKCNSIPVAQCYSVNVDYAEEYNVYAGLQDNNVWAGTHRGDESVAWHQEGDYNFKALIGGDGMQVQIDNRDNNTVYTGYQFGNYFRINKATGKTRALHVEENIGEEKLRWNWNTPLLISKSSQDILYWGSNKLHRSLDQGETWQTISGDLTGGKQEGDIAFGTLTSIDESSLQFGLIYTGSDDGKVFVTQTGGVIWSEIGASICSQLNIPRKLWVSRVIASSHKLGRVYVTLNGYRNDNFKAYIFVSNDYGVTWKNIGNNLPNQPINVIREDHDNENILYLGTDDGVYVSLNQGNTWMRWSHGMPNVPVHDMVIQKRENELVVGTHGRSIYTVDISLIKQLDEKVLNTALKLFTNAKYKLPRMLGKLNTEYDASKKTPMVEINYYAKQAGSVMIELLDSSKKTVLQVIHDTAHAGLNSLEYDYTIQKSSSIKSKSGWVAPKPAENGKVYLSKGSYILRIVQGKATEEKAVEFIEK
ncbi:MAG: glycosyl hydrolase [Bacteroidetes bacterium]|nr:glycosyl hydrolase [Bacteroidota bacterium]